MEGKSSGMALLQQHNVQVASHRLYGIPLKGGQPMLSSEELDEMSHMKIHHIDKSGLVDIASVEIDTSLSPAQRMLQYLEEVKNPYCFLCGKTSVQISFKPDGRQLGDLLRGYLLHLGDG